MSSIVPLRSKDAWVVGDQGLAARSADVST